MKRNWTGRCRGGPSLSSRLGCSARRKRGTARYHSYRSSGKERGKGSGLPDRCFIGNLFFVKEEEGKGDGTQMAF